MYKTLTYKQNCSKNNSPQQKPYTNVPHYSAGRPFPFLSFSHINFTVTTFFLSAILLFKSPLRVRISPTTPSSTSSIILITSIMETQSYEYTIIDIPDIEIDHLQSDQPKPLKDKKMSGSMRFLRVALLVMRGRSQKPKEIHQVGQIDDGSKSRWNKIVNSLHLQSNQSPCSVSDSATKWPATECGGNAFVAEEEGRYSASIPSSRYASAVGLNQLVESDDEENEKQEVIVECKEHGDGDGDEMIDSKAEDFITHFYEEMKLQRMNTVDRLKSKNDSYTEFTPFTMV
ncbi:uncharacterized protein LOC114191055 [Vigna unguiculata]|uniref:uncharacterized protein LOC114191055 n=1 Tax=Vigna unguiculata TaxID=3917 RepID=UPI001016A00C|nr:uncharacterized protein LOC114191055 [Vigna unguiculata]